MHRMSSIEDFANEIIKDRTIRGLPVPASCLWCYGSRLFVGGLKLWHERLGQLLIEAETASGLASLNVADEAEARVAAQRLAQRGLYFNDNLPR